MKRESAEALDRMYGRLAREFGTKDAETIARVLAEELGGFRLVFPDIEDMQRRARNQQICSGFDGRNYDELAIRFDRHPMQIRRIIQRAVTVARQI